MVKTLALLELDADGTPISTNLNVDKAEAKLRTALTEIDENMLQAIELSSQRLYPSNPSAVMNASTESPSGAPAGQKTIGSFVSAGPEIGHHHLAWSPTAKAMQLYDLSAVLVTI